MTQTITIDPYNKEHVITYVDGTTRTARLFKGVLYNPELICEYKPRSRRRGYPLDLTNVVTIKPKEKQINKAKKARRFLVKVSSILEKSGLWEDLKHDFRALILLDDDTLERCIYGPMSEDERTKLAKELKLHYSNPDIGFDNLAGTIDKGIKTINYNKDCSYEAEFKKAIENHETLMISWRKGYDNSVSCKTFDDNHHYAWYSEEYKNCGNGHYYLAIDEKHAIFCEDD
jgi:hypothetical protein